MNTTEGCTELTCPQHGEANRAEFHASNEGRCDARYGSNPDGCHQPAGHDGNSHTNRWGTTWPKESA